MQVTTIIPPPPLRPRTIQPENRPDLGERREAPDITWARDIPRAKPRRVLFFDHTAQMGGGEVALLNLVKYLDRRRYEPVVLVGADGPLVSRLQEAGVETHVLAVDPRIGRTRKDSLGGGTILRLGNVVRGLAFARKLSRFIRAGGFNVVHTNSLKSDVLGGIAARLAGVPVVWHVRDRIHRDYLPGPVAVVFRTLCRWIPQRVIANSAATLQTIDPTEKRSGICVVHDGTELPPTNGEAIPTIPPQQAHRPLIGLVGRISPWKGQDVFLRAAAAVRRAFPLARFQIIGAALFDEADYERSVRSLASELKLDDCVEFTGFRSDVPALIANLDVLVHASTSGEPFGQVVIEAMAAGKPVVATNGGGIPEIVLDGQTGLLVPMRDATAMADAICHLLADPASAAAMGTRGRQRVAECFTIQRTAAGVQAVFDELLGVRA
jgi:glycosyltransferase involved in cell wall biosynthesis